MEGFGRPDRVLACHRIGNEQRLGGFGDCVDFLRFGHQIVIDVKTACGIQNDDVVAFLARGLHRPLRNRLRRLQRHDRQGRNSVFLAQHLELLLRGGTAHIERRHQRLLALPITQKNREFRRGSRLTGALQPDHHDRHGRRRRQVNIDGFGAQRFRQVIVDDLDHHLAGGHRADDFFADSAHAHRVDEILDDAERDIGLKQRHAYFAQGRIDIGFGQRAALLQPVEDLGQAIAQRIEHMARNQVMLQPSPPPGHPRDDPVGWPGGGRGPAPFKKTQRK